jgi:hypothetical protein
VSTIDDLLAAADRALAGPPTVAGEVDARWQALLEVADCIRTNPDEIWALVRRWGSSPDEDVRAAVATCVLEHLLEHHFDRIFPLVEQACEHPLFADTFSLCWKFGQSELPANAARFDRLRKQLAERRLLEVANRRAQSA